MTEAVTSCQALQLFPRTSVMRCLGCPSLDSIHYDGKFFRLQRWQCPAAVWSRAESRSLGLLLCGEDDGANVRYAQRLLGVLYRSGSRIISKGLVARGLSAKVWWLTLWGQGNVLGPSQGDATQTLQPPAVAAPQGGADRAKPTLLLRGEMKMLWRPQAGHNGMTRPINSGLVARFRGSGCC